VAESDILPEIQREIDCSGAALPAARMFSLYRIGPHKKLSVIRGLFLLRPSSGLNESAVMLRALFVDAARFVGTPTSSNSPAY